VTLYGKFPQRSFRIKPARNQKKRKAILISYSQVVVAEM